jgi:signal transduction histidine kinase
MDENELRAKIADLTRRLADSEAALGAAQAGLRKFDTVAHRNERLESLGARADAVAHDLNNVFAPILMAAALLKEKVTDEKALRMLTLLESNAERGAALVRLVRDFGPGDEDSPLRKPPPPIAGDNEGAGPENFATIPPRESAPPPKKTPPGPPGV